MLKMKKLLGYFVISLCPPSFNPQNIFVLSTEEIKQLVLSLFEPEFLTIDFISEKIVFVLNNHKKSLDVLDLYHQQGRKSWI